MYGLFVLLRPVFMAQEIRAGTFAVEEQKVNWIWLEYLGTKQTFLLHALSIICQNIWETIMGTFIEMCYFLLTFKQKQKI